MLILAGFGCLGKVPSVALTGDETFWAGFDVQVFLTCFTNGGVLGTLAQERHVTTFPFKYRMRDGGQKVSTR